MTPTKTRPHVFLAEWTSGIPVSLSFGTGGWGWGEERGWWGQGPGIGRTVAGPAAVVEADVGVGGGGVAAVGEGGGDAAWVNPTQLVRGQCTYWVQLVQILIEPHMGPNRGRCW